MLLGSYSGLWEVKVNIAQEHIPYLLANHRGLRVQRRRLLPANEFPWNSRARIPRCGAATLLLPKRKGEPGIPGALNKVGFATPRSEAPRGAEGYKSGRRIAIWENHREISAGNIDSPTGKKY